MLTMESEARVRRFHEQRIFLDFGRDQALLMCLALCDVVCCWRALVVTWEVICQSLGEELD